MSEGGPGWLGVNTIVWLALIRAVIFLGVSLCVLPGLIWYERRLLSWMQDRIGPNRTGTITFPANFPIRSLRGKKQKTFGFLQPIADGAKLLLKEEIIPKQVDRLVYFIAPAIAMFPAFTLGSTTPWGPVWAGPDGQRFYQYLTPVANVDIGVLVVLAISSLGVYGVVLAGYSSNNKYSLMGGLRSSAQLISYELAMGVAVMSVVMATGSLKLPDLVQAQQEPLWGLSPYIQNWFVFTPFGFVAAVVFLICMVAETNRTPFDLPEAENELVAGYHTEYSSMKFASFFMGEYVAIFIYGGIFATVFLGGFNLMPFNWMEIAHAWPAASGLFHTLANVFYWLSPLGFLAKCAAAMTFFIWMRATLPRLRYDQLMGLGWKTLLPVAVANFIVVGLWTIFTKISENAGYGASGGWVAVAAAVTILVVLYLNILAVAKKAAPSIQGRTVRLVDPNRTS